MKKLSLAKLTNGYAAATHKDELLGRGYAKSNFYNGVRSGGYAEPPSRPPVPMEEGGWVGAARHDKGTYTYDDHPGRGGVPQKADEVREIA